MLFQRSSQGPGTERKMATRKKRWADLHASQAYVPSLILSPRHREARGAVSKARRARGNPSHDPDRSSRVKKARVTSRRRITSQLSSHLLTLSRLTRREKADFVFKLTLSSSSPRLSSSQPKSQRQNKTQKIQEEKRAKKMSQPTHQDSNVVVPVPEIGDRAPTLGDAVHFPRDKPVLVVFLRHCGCPCKSSLHTALLFGSFHGHGWVFGAGAGTGTDALSLRVCAVAEQTFQRLTDISNHHPELHCVAVTQSGPEETDKW